VDQQRPPPRRHRDVGAQAFLQAGTGAVMATLWRIDDQGSAELVSRF
jgi:hypothetical protein